MDRDQISHELRRIGDVLQAEVAAFERPEITQPLDALERAATKASKAWSQSWFGYHSRVYYKNFDAPPAGARFSSMWGFQAAISNSTRGDWVEHAFEDAVTLIRKLAGDPDLAPAESTAEAVQSVFNDAKSDAVSLLTTFLSFSNDPLIQTALDEVKGLGVLTDEEIIQHFYPKVPISSRDYAATDEGVRSAPHHMLLARVVALRSVATASSDLAKVVIRAAAHIDRLTLEVSANERGRTGTRVFIGHGGSPLWRELKDFVQDRLNLPWDEFNRVPIAGIPNTTRLAEMLDSSGIAFLVLTAEDELKDGSARARQNVVHEAGLFQGRLGFTRAIVLVEEGCEEFSNIAGLGQIRFPKARIDAAFEHVRLVLEREGFLGPD